MPRIHEAVFDQVERLIDDLLKEDPRTLTRIGISKQNRNYLKNRVRRNKRRQLPPADAVMAGLIVLQRDIVVEVNTGRGNDEPRRYLITARAVARDVSSVVAEGPVQMSILAGLDFSTGSVATIQRAERKGPNRVELHLDVAVQPKTA